MFKTSKGEPGQEYSVCVCVCVKSNEGRVFQEEGTAQAKAQR